MLRRRSSSILAAIAVFASVGATALATGPASAAPAVAGVCGSGHETQALIGFSPNYYAVAPANITITLDGNTIDGPKGCTAVLDFGDGQTQTLTDASPVSHFYQKTGHFEVTLLLNWPNYKVQPIEEATFIGQGLKGQANVGRLYGKDRLDTAVQISMNQWLPPDPHNNWGQAHTAVLATSANFPDALSGVPLAAYKQGPLLLTNRDALYPGADTEINRILPKGSVVYILGGTAVISPAIENQLTAEGYKTQRFGGANRFETSLMIAQQGLNNPPNVVVATGRDFPDALSAGPLASGPRATRLAGSPKQPAAVILTDGASFFDAGTAAFVKSRLQTQKSNIDCKAVSAVGGAATKAVAPLVAPGQCWDNNLVGSDRYDTSNKVMNEFSNEYLVGLATGRDFPDALAGGAHVANLDQPLLLTAPDSLSSPVGGWFNGMYVQDGFAQVVIYGGLKAVSQHVSDQVYSAAHTGSYLYP